MSINSSLNNTSRQTALSSPGGFLAFGLSSGLSPHAPGTVGTLIGMLLWIPMVHVPLAFSLALILILFLIGIGICQQASSEMGVHDHGGIVWDEMVAIWLVLVFIPFDWRWWLAAFVLFRLFDIVKVWPVNWFDRRVSGGLGIMMDDIIAALYTLGALWLIRWLISLL